MCLWQPFSRGTTSNCVTGRPNLAEENENAWRYFAGVKTKHTNPGTMMHLAQLYQHKATVEQKRFFLTAEYNCR